MSPGGVATGSPPSATSSTEVVVRRSHCLILSSPLLNAAGGGLYYFCPEMPVGQAAVGPMTPLARANMTSSARVSSCSFRITCARWVSTVRTEMKSFFAISWFV
jgi:hypothetical protein